MSKLILSLDGGGIRGAATTQFLQLVEKELRRGAGPRSIRSCVDFYAGTSTGSIIALGLATTNLSMDDINSLYNVTNARKIFKENRGWFEWDGVNAPRYEGSGKSEVLKKNFGEATLAEVARNKGVLAVTYAVERRVPMVLKSTNPDFAELPAWQVADASSAAPTYFPTRDLELKQVSTDDFWLVDGGVIANNPTMCAIAEVRREWGTPMSDMSVLSIGTGYVSRKINGPASRHWGAAQWVTKGDLLSIVTDERIVSYQTMNLIDPGRCIRVNAEMKKQPGLPNPPDDAMDDISPANLRKLRDMGKWWFDLYGADVVKLLKERNLAASVDSVDPESGKPVVRAAGSAPAARGSKAVVKRSKVSKAKTKAVRR